MGPQDARSRFGTVLQQARERGEAVGAFTCYDLLQFEAVVRAAEATARPVIVLVSPGSLGDPGGSRLVAAFRAAATSADVDVLVQLDHVKDGDLIDDAAAAGIDAVLADGSSMELADNVAFAAAMVERHRPAGVGFEGELGRIQGDEDRVSGAMAAGLTDPDDAERFVQQTGLDCLAVSIGNVHGTYREPPQLDWDRLAAIADRCPVPLALHGASGLEATDVRRAVTMGVAKVNYNTELRAAYLEAVERGAPAARARLDLRQLHSSAIDAVEAVVRSRIDLLTGGAVLPKGGLP